MPEAYRRKGWIAAMYVPLRAALEFISLAALIPVLVIILDSGWQEQDTVPQELRTNENSSYGSVWP